MTTPTDEQTPAPTVNDARNRDTRFVNHLLMLRDDAAARSALRRGDQPALAYRAQIYLAPWFPDGAGMDAASLFAAAFATHSRYGGEATATVPVGQVLYRHAGATHTGRRFEPADAMPGRRVIAMQRQTLPVAHRTLAGMLQQLDRSHAASIDWRGLWTLYRLWDIPTSDTRRRVRRRILLDYFGSDTFST